jgi:hypothetical protein
MKEKLKEKLLPLYENLLKNIEFNDIRPFCMEWGNNFPIEKKSGILFVGKATNGWVTDSKEIDKLFGESCDGQIFAREIQMMWVADPKKPYYKTSAFWRVIKRIAEIKNGNEEWYSKIAWSNLYKISLEKGNPSGKLIEQQIESCKEILNTEIEILNPKYVIFLTSGWENRFIETIQLPKEKEVIWGKNYKTIGYSINNRVYITSVHPQMKNEDEHVAAILKIMEHFESNL